MIARYLLMFGLSLSQYSVSAGSSVQWGGQPSRDCGAGRGLSATTQTTFLPPTSPHQSPHSTLSQPADSRDKLGLWSLKISLIFKHVERRGKRLFIF